MNPENTQPTPDQNNNPAPEPVVTSVPFASAGEAPVTPPASVAPVQYVQPPVAAPVPTAPANPVQVTGEIPGHTLGIVGFVFFFVALQIPGLIMCIIALKQSTKAGYKNTLAKVGIWLNAIGIVLVALVLTLMVLVTIAAYNQERINADKTTQQNNAMQQEAQDEQSQTDSSDTTDTSSDTSSPVIYPTD